MSFANSLTGESRPLVGGGVLVRPMVGGGVLVRPVVGGGVLVSTLVGGGVLVRFIKGGGVLVGPVMGEGVFLAICFRWLSSALVGFSLEFVFPTGVTPTGVGEAFVSVAVCFDSVVTGFVSLESFVLV